MVGYIVGSPRLYTEVACLHCCRLLKALACLPVCLAVSLALLDEQVTLYQQGLEEQPSDKGTGDAEDAGGGSSGEEKLGRMSFVDLAGSERAQRTGNVGVRLK